MNSNILSQVSGGVEVSQPFRHACSSVFIRSSVNPLSQYDTVYPAGADQVSTAGTQDVR